jgi:hypothetical protein
MPVEIRRRLPQSGRIRIGQKGAKGQPVRLETFRLTSADERLLQQAAALYGGEVRPWKDREGEYELITDRKELPVLVTPEPLETWYELWSAAGCQRRCDGDSCTTPDGKGGLQQQACLCDPDRRECQLKTRVNFLLPDLPGIGVWRLDTGSYFTAAEMPGQVELLHRAAQQRYYPEADLAIEPRVLKTRDQQGKPITRRFPVATLRIRMSLRELFGAQGVALPERTEEPRRALPVNTRTGEVIDEPPALSNGNGHTARNGVDADSPVTKARNAYFAELHKLCPWLRGKEDLRRCFEAVLVGQESPLADGQKADWTDTEWNYLRTCLTECDPKKAPLQAKAMLNEAHAAAQQTGPAPEAEAQIVSEGASEGLPDPFQDDASAAEPALAGSLAL